MKTFINLSKEIEKLKNHAKVNELSTLTRNFIANN